MNVNGTPQRRKTKQNGKFEANRTFIINDQNAPRLVPALAKEIGLNESILFLQIEFWIAITDNIREGRKWTCQSTSDIQKTFPFWSDATIKRIVKSLKEQNLILTDNFNKLSFDKTNWFAINLEGAAKLESISIKGSEQPVVYDDEVTEETDELTLMVEKIWQKFKAFNQTVPVDKLQKDAVKQLANHVMKGEASINDIVWTAQVLSGAEYHMTPLVPTSILKHISEWKYSESYFEGLYITKFDDLYEYDSDDDIDFEGSESYSESGTVIPCGCNGDNCNDCCIPF